MPNNNNLAGREEVKARFRGVLGLTVIKDLASIGKYLEASG